MQLLCVWKASVLWKYQCSSPFLSRHCGYIKAKQDPDEEKMQFQHGRGKGPLQKEESHSHTLSEIWRNACTMYTWDKRDTHLQLITSLPVFMDMKHSQEKPEGDSIQSTSIACLRSLIIACIIGRQSATEQHSTQSHHMSLHKCLLAEQGSLWVPVKIMSHFSTVANKVVMCSIM